MKRIRLVLPILLLLAAGSYGYAVFFPPPLVLTGIVTTNDVIVSPQVAGQVSELLVAEGDTVKKDQTLAMIRPDELRADTNYYAQNAEGLTSQVKESEAALRFEESQTGHQTAQAESTLAALQAQVVAGKAELDVAASTYARTEDLARQKIASSQDLDQARSVVDAAKAKLEALKKEVDAQRAAVALAQANAEQISLRRSAVQASRHMASAAEAQRAKADVRLAYAELKAPIDGVVDVRAVRAGEYVNAGAPVLTLVNPDDLWVRADVEETYIDRVKAGDKMTVRFPSGETREGTIFFRGVDAGYATQRDVSRTKRDIKTFEIRLRVDNADRKMALGMTAYVSLPAR